VQIELTNGPMPMWSMEFPSGGRWLLVGNGFLGNYSTAGPARHSPFRKPHTAISLCLTLLCIHSGVEECRHLQIWKKACNSQQKKKEKKTAKMPKWDEGQRERVERVERRKKRKGKKPHGRRRFRWCDKRNRDVTHSARRYKTFPVRHAARHIYRGGRVQTHDDTCHQASFTCPCALTGRPSLWLLLWRP
jgi:hypothetical protein